MQRHTHWGITFILGTAGILSGACRHNDWRSESEVKQFFAQSTRRDANFWESRVTVRIPYCTGFFVENSLKKTYVGTARHCFLQSPADWCAQDGSFSDNFGYQGRCRQLIATDATHDTVIFDADLPYTPEAAYALQLYGTEPKLNQPLQMIGYPADPYRNNALTVTENCWVLAADISNPYQDPHRVDRAALHNCTTYGGNSGGPMLLKGTRAVMGIPFSYKKGDFNPRSPTDLQTAAYMAKMSEFIALHRNELQAAGVVVVP